MPPVAQNLHAPFDNHLWTVYPVKETLVLCIDLEEKELMRREELPRDTGRRSYGVVYKNFPDESIFNIYFGGYFRRTMHAIPDYSGETPVFVSIAEPLTRSMIANVNAVIRANSGSLMMITPHSDQMVVS